MTIPAFGRLLSGPADAAALAYESWLQQPVDLDLLDDVCDPADAVERTIAEPVTVSGPGTFTGHSNRTLTLEPCEGGWWFDRTDLPDYLPTKVSIRNVWTIGAIISNIVLRSGPPHNYIRMVEHMIALKLGMGVDNLMIRMDSGDPPLFERGSLDLVEAMESAGIAEQKKPVRYLTVKETITVANPSGGFLIIKPCPGNQPVLKLDCAIDFSTAIAKQRIRFLVTHENFRQASVARTNTSSAKRLYCQTIGKIFADIRNLGYTDKNILVAGRTKYVNEPRLLHQEKSLEAAWHRAALDLLAALALVEEGRFVGEVISYKSGHALDVHMITQLYLHDLLTEVCICNDR